MSKKHFEGIAAILASIRPPAHRDSTLWRLVVDRIADWCERQTADKAQGSRFKRDVFIARCNGNKSADKPVRFRE